MKKLTLLAGAAVGYVAGSAAGRQRYEQIKSLARRFMRNPKVQEAASEVTHKMAGAATTVGHAAASKVGRHSSDTESEFAPAAPNGYPPPS